MSLKKRFVANSFYCVFIIRPVWQLTPRGQLYKPVVLNTSPRDPLFCILCMSTLFNTPDSDPQLIRIDSLNLTLLDKIDIQNVQSSGS